MPPNLAALSNKYILECPLTGTDYVYRSLDKPAADDVICWDSHPHEPQHNVFTFLNQPNRNILTTDGKVHVISEEKFQASHLQGATLTVHP